MNIYKTKLTDLGVDRRVKLDNETKDYIRELYATGNWSYKTLAEEFDVSKSLIRWIIKEEAYADFLIKHKERLKNKFDKDKHNEYMRNYRKQKKELILN